MDITLDKKLQGFRQIAQEKLQNILCSIPDNQKYLIIETCLIQPLEHICGASWLRAKGVNKIYKFDSKNPPPRTSTMVYFISSNLITFKNVLDQIQGINIHQQTEKQISDIGTKPFHLIVLPNVLHSFDMVLEECGLFGYVELHRFNWDFISIDTGVLSLEIPQVFKEVFIRGDTSLLSSVAHSLRILNLVCRKPSMVITVGENAAKVANMIDQIEGFESTTITSEENSDFHTMVIMDRNKDYASVLLTPVIYSGLLLELFRVVAGTLQIDEHKNRIQSEKLHFLKNSSKKNATNENETITRLSLNDSVDGIYVENRYKHFKHFVNLLSLRAKALGMEGRNIQGMEINEMKNFVKKLPKVTSQKKELFKHLILCENIVNEIGSNFELSQTIEESMLYNRNKKQTFQKILELLTTDAHRYNSLRFICLLHLTCGLNADEAATFMTNYLNAFGYQHFPIFGHLGVAKLYPSFNNSAKTKVFNISFPMIQNAFQIEANRMKLLPGNIDGRRDPVDSSFVFNGSYIPFIAQLLNVLCSASKIDDFAEKFGQTEHILFYRFYQQHLELGTKEMMSAIKKGEISDIFPLRSRTIFCFVIGGITCGELAAIHFIERMTGSKIVVASDCISSGTDFVEAAFF